MTRAAAAALLLVAFIAAPACAPPAWWGDGGQAVVRSPADNACTWSPDLVAGSCCYLHDLAYGRGGDAGDRVAADAQLFACLVTEGVPEPLAMLYYAGVRSLGWARWHYDPGE